jgi:hypothetical protein
MTAPIRTRTFTENGTRYVLELRDVYDVAGSTVASAFGLTRAADNFEPEENDVGLSVSQGLENGKLAKIRVSYRTASGKTRSARLVCPTSRIDTAIRAVKIKTYKNGNVVGAGIPRRRELR